MTKLQRLYFEILRIRKVEVEIARRYSDQQMRTPIHLSHGQESVAVGIASLLEKEDLMVSTHRAHAHYLSKGGSLRALIAELHGKATGCSRGHGGSMRIIDLDCGFECSASIVGGTMPIGVGLAWAKKLKKDPGLVVVWMGDASLEEGVAHESMNFASLHQLPVVFICENNLFSCYTHIRERQPDRPLIDIARAHKLEFISLNGNDVLNIADWCRGYIHDVRTKSRPLFIEMKTYRQVEHCGPVNDDHLGYRDEKETKLWMERDPISITEHQLHAAKEWTPEFIESFALIDEEIREAFEFAITSPFPKTGVSEYAPTVRG